MIICFHINWFHFSLSQPNHEAVFFSFPLLKSGGVKQVYGPKPHYLVKWFDTLGSICIDLYTSMNILLLHIDEFHFFFSHRHTMKMFLFISILLISSMALSTASVGGGGGRSGSGSVFLFLSQCLPTYPALLPSILPTIWQKMR
jgi:hypothetical protein